MKFNWTAECRVSFKKLKSLLSSSKVMMNYDGTRPTHLYVDHAPGGIAATMAQGYKGLDGKLVYRPVHPSSRVLTEMQTQYSKVEGESLVVLSGNKGNKM